jgi:hypothetical protein
MDFDELFALHSFIPGYYNTEDRVSDGKLMVSEIPGYLRRFSLLNSYYEQTGEP